MAYADLMNKRNVVSVGTGYKFRNGKKTEKICTVVGVSKKLPLSQLRKCDIIQDDEWGISTDVVEVGEYRALAPTDRQRPAPPGVSVAHFDVTAGTFGCVVRKGDIRYILSNNHVLANSNDAEIGDAIYQPGPHDGGVSADTIAHLSDFVEIKFGGGQDCPIARAIAGVSNTLSRLLGRRSRLEVVRVGYDTPQNVVDAAIAEPVSGDDISDGILDIGVPTGIEDPELGTLVQKSGRTTGYTTGEILQVGTTVTVGYGGSKRATFHNQVITSGMAAGGDSGSALLDMDNKLVGLLFAGSDNSTVFNPMFSVFEYLDVEL